MHTHPKMATRDSIQIRTAGHLWLIVSEHFVNLALSPVAVLGVLLVEIDCLRAHYHQRQIILGCIVYGAECLRVFCYQ